MADAKDAKPAQVPAEKVEEPTKSFWLVITRDETDIAPQCIRCDSAESLTRAIEEHVHGATTPLHVFAFEGWRIEISSPRPICSFKVGEERVDVGCDSAEFDEGGRIVPLAKPDVGT